MKILLGAWGYARCMEIVTILACIRDPSMHAARSSCIGGQITEGGVGLAGVLSTEGRRSCRFRGQAQLDRGRLLAMETRNTMDEGPNAAVHALNGLGKVATRGQLAAVGVTRNQLDAAVHLGTVQRVRTGVYCLPDVHPSVREAAAHGGALTCCTLLSLWDIWMLHEVTSVHVWMGLGGRRHEHARCRCRPHFSPGRMRLGAVPMWLALLHLYACQGAEAFICALDSALNQGKLNAAAREKVRTGLPKNARWLMDFARKGAASGLETLIRFRLRHYGFKIVVQYAAGADDVDLLIEDLLIVEADGKANHDGPSKRHKDLMRDARTSSLGYETLRFDYAQIVYEWPMVLKAILAGLERAKGRR